MRLLILTDDPSAATNLHDPLEEIAGGEDLDVKVVAPLRPESTLDLVTGEIDDADDEGLAAAVRERHGLPVTELSAG
jgi:hypothetical protein